MVFLPQRDRWILEPYEYNTLTGQVNTLSLNAPNPATDLVRVNFPVALEAATLQVFDLSGKLLSDQVVPAAAEQAVIDIAHLPAGIYLLRKSDTPQVIRVVKR